MLGIERIEILLQPGIARDPGIDGAADGLSGSFFIILTSASEPTCSGDRRTGVRSSGCR